MTSLVLFVFLYFQYGDCKLWAKGIVHYTINKKDYDPHSQDVIVSTFDRIENEICVKFFNTPYNYSASNIDKVLYISNPDKRKTCAPDTYNYEGSVVDMPIGYKCLNEFEISRIVVDMLRASIQPTVQPSNELLRKFQKKNDDNGALLSAADRNFINAHYHLECSDLIHKPVQTRRTSGGTMELTADNENYYKNKIWPLGIVMYGVHPIVRRSNEFTILQDAMTLIEQSSCVVFQQVSEEDPLQPKNLLWFDVGGEDVPHFGFLEGNQTLYLPAMVNGAPGHKAHTLYLLLRVLGIPMMSNRYDRDNYVIINWKHVLKTKEHYLERDPIEAWLRNTDGDGAAYDYDSATHAPANFMCRDCSLGAQTVQPIQDHLWQRTLTMGHRTDLSPTDIEMLSLLYSKECNQRSMNSK